MGEVTGWRIINENKLSSAAMMVLTKKKELKVFQGVWKRRSSKLCDVVIDYNKQIMCTRRKFSFPWKCFVCVAYCVS